MPLRDYPSLITSQHQTQPQFMEVVSLLTGVAGSVYDATMGIIDAFNLDTAIGSQLDIIGLWVGFPRKQRVPVSGAYFTWDDAALGFDVSNWLDGYGATEGVVILDDDTYRVMLKAQIGSNYWSGSNLDVNVIGGSAFNGFGGLQCFVLDNLDMTTTVYILGSPTAVMIEMIKRGVAPPKTAGVRVTGYILASTPGAPFFALDVYTTPEVAGLDFGSFGDPV